MSTKNLISIAAVVIGIMLVWTLVKKAMFYAVIAGVVYLLYTFFVASSTGSKKE